MYRNNKILKNGVVGSVVLEVFVLCSVPLASFTHAWKFLRAVCIYSVIYLPAIFFFNSKARERYWVVKCNGLTTPQCSTHTRRERLLPPALRYSFLDPDLWKGRWTQTLALLPPAPLVWQWHCHKLHIISYSDHMFARAEPRHWPATVWCQTFPRPATVWTLQCGGGKCGGETREWCAPDFILRPSLSKDCEAATTLFLALSAN